jgi:hypothetical protein
MRPPDAAGAVRRPARRARCGQVRRAAACSALVVLLLAPGTAAAWVSAYLERAEVAVRVEPDGTAAAVCTACYVVEAGRFGEFKLHAVPPAAEIDLAASYVEDDHGRRYAIDLYGKRGGDGTVRFALAAGARIPKGRATCRIAFRENWLQAGYARVEDGTLAVDWRPPVFPDGMERMTVDVLFGGDDTPLAFSVPEDLVPTLEPRSTPRSLTLSRFRPAAFYEMPVRFSVRAASATATQPVLAARGPVAAPPRPHRSTPPVLRPHVDASPLLAVLPVLGCALLGLRVRHARRVAPAAGGVQPYLLLPSLGAPLRWPLVAAGLAGGAWLLLGGRALPGLACQAAAVLLALPDRFRWLERGGVGTGPWRALAAPSPRTWRSLAAAAHCARRSTLDAGGPLGLCLLVLVVCGAGLAIHALLAADLRVAMLVAADALLLLVPPFLVAPERALPPVLPAEAGAALERVRRALRPREEGRDLDVGFLVQDDAAGRPAEIRMRVRRPAARAARTAEVAAEWRLSRWGWHSTFAVLVHVPAGSRLRASPGVFPRDGTCRFGAGLDRETWIVRAPTARSAAARLIDLLERAERAFPLCRSSPSEKPQMNTDEHRFRRAHGSFTFPARAP